MFAETCSVVEGVARYRVCQASSKSGKVALAITSGGEDWRAGKVAPESGAASRANSKARAMMVRLMVSDVTLDG